MARVLLFGRLADQAGWRERLIAADDLGALRAVLAGENPRLGEALVAPGVQVAVDKALVRGEALLSPQTEVAFLPPMSGG
ncbi:MoaD/ThiS family protein [Caulobacter segnis]|uniref:MoaD/ThiS family protein n=1 Tax=Caulobacter segnis TaxID=88688 RepID=UPI00285FC5AB|nr:MoaD/ThiS family protein [Caulobacter segnis]MDR6623910.1 molybdopterin synthase sulfur carrier subunit [Caulobacter segnis]